MVTLVGWFAILLGLFRMFAPELFLQGYVQNTSTMMLAAPPMVLSAIGIYLTFKAYRRE